MPSWLFASWTDVGEAAAKAALMVAVAVVGLRGARRRTLAQWSVVDVVTAVSVGAIVGRTAVADTEAFATGATALLAVLVVHRVASRVRMSRVGSRLLDHRVRVLAVDGRISARQCRRRGLTAADVSEQLRLRGVFDLADVRYVIYEEKGGLSIVHRTEADAPLVREALDAAGEGNAT